MVLENRKCKILWEFTIQANTEVEHGRPGTVIIDKEKKRECKIIDMAALDDDSIKASGLKKITKYKDLRLQLQRLWNAKATVISVIIGALEKINEKLEKLNKSLRVFITLSWL